MTIRRLLALALIVVKPRVLATISLVTLVSDTNKSWQPRREFSSPERNVSPNIPHIYVYGSQDAGSALKSQTGPPQEGPDKKLSKGEQTSDPKTQN